MVYLDLAELEMLTKHCWFFSINKPNIVSFWRKHHLGNADIDLDTSVRDLVQTHTHQRPTGPIRLLTHLSYFGYRFNPVSFYYCYAEDGRQLQYIVSEVNNTPWGEQHCYVHTVSDAKTAMHRFEFNKVFHVSPFLPMDIDYDWRFRTPGEHLNVHMIDKQGTQTVFDATLLLTQQPLTSSNLALQLLRFPLMTLKVISAIYYQALKLWLKRIPFHPHPDKQEASVRTKTS